MNRPLWLAVAAALVASGLAGTPTPAGADTSFTMYGQGWGHGVGMGQYGIYGLAQDGSKYRGMLTYYYEGTTTDLISSPSTIRVGLLEDQGKTQLDATNGSIVLRLDDPDTGSKVATIPQDQTWTIEFHTDGKFWVKRQTGTYVGAKGWGGTGDDLFANYFDQGTIASVPDTGHEYKYGYFEFDVYKPSGTYRGRMIAVVGTNVYVHGISEVPASWPMEALKAQATASRTYAVYKADTYGQHQSGCNCAVDAGILDQVYIGYDQEKGTDGSRWVQAADDTRWRVVEYGGSPISANFSSSTGGYTESNSVAFGGTQVPYLTAECDPGDYTSANPNRSWQVTLTGAQIGNDIQSYFGTDIGDATSFNSTTRSSSGRIDQTTVMGTNGSITVGGSDLRLALGLKSALFYVNSDRRVTGDIRTKYDDLTCAPGLPLGPQQNLTGGLQQNFTDGTIYDDTTNDVASYLTGDTVVEYGAVGGPAGILGFPSSDVVDRGTFAKTTFVQDGAIYWSTDTGAHEIHGVVKDEYYALNGATGTLGLPTTDVVSAGGTDTSTFQGGTISCPSGGSTNQCTVTYG